eukprot:TRINITY_DN59481_c0_g1_i1.p1 TRINITY_DN59481_c0_g1~~TRINITY_DN59481_c0_g1_i1.p1  ORF type:complete len:760 (-),score=69.97 TRINITY_DN59481_c0_g1_i1:149-2161(-)
MAGLPRKVKKLQELVELRTKIKIHNNVCMLNSDCKEEITAGSTSKGGQNLETVLQYVSQTITKLSATAHKEEEPEAVPSPVTQLSKQVHGAAVRSCASHLLDLDERLRKDFRVLLQNCHYAEFRKVAKDFVVSDIDLQKLKSCWSQICTVHELYQEDSFKQVRKEKPINKAAQLFLQPHDTKFLYHFTGKKQTNRIDKPEWFFTYMSDVMNDYLCFVSQFDLTTNALNHRSLHTGLQADFIEGVVEILKRKLTQCLQFLQEGDNSQLFVHHITLCLAFDQELTQNHGYPSSYRALDTSAQKSKHTHRQHTMDVVQDDLLLSDYWLQLETTFAETKFKEMVTQPEAWCFQFARLATLDEMKVSQLAYNATTLLYSLNEKYSAISNMELLGKFINNIHMNLIDLFLGQMQDVMEMDLADFDPNWEVPALLSSAEMFSANSWATHCSALNSATFLANVLSAWSDLPVFSDLQLFLDNQSGAIKRKRKRNVERDGVGIQGDEDDAYDIHSGFFDAKANQLVLFCDVLSNHLREAMMETFKSTLGDKYRKQLNWYTLQQSTTTEDGTDAMVNTLNCQCMSPTMHVAASSLLAQLNFLGSFIVEERYSFVWRGLATLIDGYLAKHIIDNKRFPTPTEAEVQQMDVDIRSLAVLLFSHCSASPNQLFIKSQQALAKQ